VNDFDINAYRVTPGAGLDLSAHDPDDQGPFAHVTDNADDNAADKKSPKRRAQKATEKLAEQIDQLQARLWAEGKASVLLVIQAMDTGGKDGVIRTVGGAMNPAGVHVAAFKAPTEEELAHDFLWRIHRHTPARGDVTIFNRSHYEDVLIVAVHGWITPEECEQRYGIINTFEQSLVERGSRIVKCFLNISKDEQARRLQARLDDDAKRWKFRLGDIKEREHWDAYTDAYEKALAATSTPHAPWYVVPANHKWYRDWVVASLLHDTLVGIDPQFPAPEEDLTGVKVI
jgi:PPK2 family polyphosphate:nucleotide phosphotransferase